MQINWPEGINEEIFLQQYWQQKPLLIPQALENFSNPLDENELAGLACDPDANARFMQHVQGNEWRMCMGPLDDDFFDDVTGNKWSLLVSDIEKLLPDFRDYLQPFRFLPDWRIDDLMISYAPPGGSVGAHVDQYDVFLLQASGVREWQIETTARIGRQESVSNDISLLGDFTADETMRLRAGDMLYLPPHFAHHGIAIEDACMTWSIGFRAPSADEMLPSILNYISDDMQQPERFTDSGRSKASNPGLIEVNDKTKLRQLLATALEYNDQQLDDWIGRYLTEAKDTSEDTDIQTLDWRSLKKQIGAKHRLNGNSYKTFAYSPATEGATLYADGESYPCSMGFAEQLCSQRWVTAVHITETDHTAVTALFNRHVLLLEADSTH